MKRFVCLITTCLFLLTGCWNQSESYYTKPVHFYYPFISYELTGEKSVIDYELREGADFSSDIELLKNYLEGPNNGNFYSPFPVGTTLVDYGIFDDRVCIYLSQHFNELTGISFTIATSCIAMTVLNYTGHNFVDINVMDANNQVKTFVTLARDQILLNDSYRVPPAE